MHAVAAATSASATASTVRHVGFGVGELYAANYFPPEAKAKMEALVANLKAAYARAHREARLDEPGHQGQRR